MNKYNLLALPFVLFTSVALAERDCPEYYVDIADEDEALYDHCDFKKSGLNGWIHSKMDENSAPQTDEAVSEVADSAQSKAAVSSVQPKATGEVSSQTALTEPAANAVQLQEQRFSTLQQLAKNCANGYKIESESYQAVEGSEQLQLAIQYQCL